MLDFIDNRKKNDQLDALNAKIALYNKSSTDAALQSALLQEIYYFAKTLRSMVIDDEGFGPYAPILSWSGIDKELALRDKAGILDLAIEKSLISLQKSEEPLPSTAKWLSETQSNPFLRFIGRRSQSGLNLQQDLDRLQRLKASHHDESLEYFYALQETKAHVIHALNFDLVSQTELHNYRLFVGYVNHELDTLIQASPKLALRYADTNTAARDLGKLAVGFTPEKIMSEWGALLPQEAGYDMQLMGGNNSRNCLFTNELAEVIVLRIEILSTNQSVLDSLRCTPINEYFLPEHGRFISDHYMLTVSDYAYAGDLRTHREKEQCDDHLTIIQQATDEIGQLTQFCQMMLNHHTIHPDIKLSNFLLDKGRVLIADKKTFVRITPEGLVRRGDLISTFAYAPPEYKGTPAHTLLNADKFMSYQIGLSLYDYLVLPDENSNVDELYWSQKELDFHKPIFKTQMGPAMQELIKQATHPDPEKRLGVAGIMTSLQRIQRQSQSQAIVMNEALSVVTRAARSVKTDKTAVSHKVSVPLTPSADVLIIEKKEDHTESTYSEPRGRH